MVGGLSCCAAVSMPMRSQCRCEVNADANRSALARQGTQEEQQVGGTFGEPAGEVPVPVGPVRHVYPNGLAGRDQPFLFVRANPEEHLMLPVVGGASRVRRQL